MNVFEMREKINTDPNLKKLWEQVISKESDMKKINEMFLQSINQCIGRAGDHFTTDTSEVLCSMDDLLREEDVAVFFVARKAHAPLFCAKTHSGKDCVYYLQIVNSEEKRNALFAREECADATENRKRLELCGLRVFDAAAEDAENRRKNPHLYLPDDLCTSAFDIGARTLVEPHYYIVPATALFYNSNLRVDLLETYAKETRANKLSKALAGTGIVPMRTLAPISLWLKISTLLKKQASERQAFMQTHVCDSIYEQLIPLGFQVFGTVEKYNYLLQALPSESASPAATAGAAAASAKRQNARVPPTAALGEKHVVYEIYAAPFRRFHIDVSADEHDAISRCTDEADLRIHLAVLSKRANVDEKEFSLIKTWPQLERNIFLNIVK